MSKYVIGETHPNTQSYATFETKPSHPDYTGGGYERWRSTEWRSHTSRKSKEDVYVGHHRLLAVAVCYDDNWTVQEILDDLHGKDVHHESGCPWDNRPDNLTVMDHGSHASVTNAEMRAWAEDAKRAAQNDDDSPVRDDDVCDVCGETVETLATSPGFTGKRCIECATQAVDDEPIELT